jgi:branched-chain amino acid transport system permease protein
LASAWPALAAVLGLAARFLAIHRRGNLAQLAQWVLVIQGAIFVFCVLAFRRGIVSELAALLRIKL